MKGWRNGSSTSILHLEGFRLIRQSSRGLLFTYIVAPWNYVSTQFRPSSVIVLGGRRFTRLCLETRLEKNLRAESPVSEFTCSNYE